MPQNNKDGRGGVRRGAGRPEVAPTKRRAHRVTFNLTQGEFAKLKKASGAMLVSAFVRDIVLAVLSLKRRK